MARLVRWPPAAAARNRLIDGSGSARFDTKSVAYAVATSPLDGEKSPEGLNVGLKTPMGARGAARSDALEDLFASYPDRTAIWTRVCCDPSCGYGSRADKTS